MDILITGAEGTGKTRAAQKLIADHFGQVFNTISVRQLLILDVVSIARVDVLRETIRAARVEAVLFDGCITSAYDLVLCLQAVKEAREQVGRNFYVVYVRLTEGALVIEPHPENILLSEIFVMGDTRRSTIVPASNRASLEDLGVSTMRRMPLTWDNTKQAFEAADLELDGVPVCSAVNVYAFTKFGHKTPSTLFELAEIVQANGFHAAVDKMSTDYFKTGRFPQKGFNGQFCRPATPTEVLEYLNAKYVYGNQN